MPSCLLAPLMLVVATWLVPSGNCANWAEMVTAPLGSLRYEFTWTLAGECVCSLVAMVIESPLSLLLLCRVRAGGVMNLSGVVQRQGPEGSDLWEASLIEMDHVGTVAAIILVVADFTNALIQ